jgi:hypothetical protein
MSREVQAIKTKDSLGQVLQIKQLTDSIYIFRLIMPSSGVAIDQIVAGKPL